MTSKNTRLSVDAYFLGLAQRAALRSTCVRRQVGCVLVDCNKHQLATGYNGVPRNFKHCNEGHACPGATAVSGVQLDLCYAVHAEQNALLQCSDVFKIETCYCTTTPCITCIKMLLNTSCQRIVVVSDYVHVESHLLWDAAGRTLQIGA